MSSAWMLLPLLAALLPSIQLPASTPTNSEVPETATLIILPVEEDSSLRPEVRWLPNGGSEWQRVIGPTQLVEVGDQVRTGGQTHANILLVDRALAFLAPHTQMGIDRLEHGADGDLLLALSQSEGSATFLALPGEEEPIQFIVETPAVRVRGNRLVIDVSPTGQTHISQFGLEAGEVQARDGSGTPSRLPPGMDMTVSPGQPPMEPTLRPTPVLPSVK
jgi:hypothetical protein